MSEQNLSNEELRHRLEDVMTHARENEQKHQLFQAMELKLLSKETLLEVCSVLVNDYRKAFNVEIVNLLLVDSGGQLHNMLEGQESLSPSINEHVQLVSGFDTLNKLGKIANKPMIGAYSREQHKDFYKEEVTFSIKSVAVLPIYRHGLLLGFLSFGSSDSERYQNGMATDFLERLALITAISIENIKNIEYLRQLGLVDPLTHVFNRRYFFQRLDDEVMRALRHSHQLACLYVDIDNFKKVNDQYGHAAGDSALLHVVRFIEKSIRSSDILARLGGEEFAILLPQVSRKGVLEVAERIRSVTEQEACELTTKLKITLTLSIGVSILDGDSIVGEPSEVGQMLLNAADNALDEAKNAGGNCLRLDALLHT